MKIDIQFTPKKDLIGLIIILIFVSYIFWIYNSSYTPRNSNLNPSSVKNKNLIKNHDFETLVSQTGDLLNNDGQRIQNLSILPVYPEGFSFNKYHGWKGAENSFNIVTEKVKSGKFALNITSSEPSGFLGMDYIAIEAESYTYSIFAKGTKGSELKFAFYAYDKNKQNIHKGTGIDFKTENLFELDEEWKEYECKINFKNKKVSFVLPVLIILGDVTIDKLKLVEN